MGRSAKCEIVEFASHFALRFIIHQPRELLLTQTFLPILRLFQHTNTTGAISLRQPFP
jgi:hypothetical protein